MYAPSLRLLREYVRPADELAVVLDRVHSHLLSHFCYRALMLGVHIRRGDYSSDDGAYFRSIPVQWYIDWVEDMQLHPERVFEPAQQAQDGECTGAGQPVKRVESLTRAADNDVVLVLISDEADRVAEEFAAHNLSVLTSRQLLEQAVGPYLSLTPLVTSFYFDWWLFGQLHVSATSHSTFSYTAAMFNSHLTARILDSEANSGGALTSQSVLPSPQPPFVFAPNSTSISLTAIDPWHVAYYHLQFWHVNFTRVARTPEAAAVQQ